MNSVIPCDKGVNCNWPACKMNCPGRPGYNTPADDSSDVALITYVHRIDGLVEVRIENARGDSTVCILHRNTVELLMYKFWRAEQERNTEHAPLEYNIWNMKGNDQIGGEL